MPEEQLFSTVEVAAACGISFRRLDNWVRRGYVTVSQPAHGSGSQRRFEFAEAMQVLLTAELARIGVKPGTVQRSQMKHEEYSAVPGSAVWVRWDNDFLRCDLQEKLGVSGA